MRTDEERDQLVDDLLSRVRDLESEIENLRGLAARAPGTATAQKPSGPSSTAALPSKPKTENTAGKTADASLESAIGTRWIGRIGVMAILFGIAFFLKYSFDNKLIGETGRVILGMIWGVLFIGAGEYLQKKKNLALYGQMLSGGGLAVLYLSLYAAFALYHLLPGPLAFAGMLAVTTAGMTLSTRYTAYSLAALALLGGFLTPVMLSTGQNQPFILFGYVLLLDTGTLLLLRFRHWPSLAVASLTGTVLLYSGWHTQYYTDAQNWTALGIITVFFLFYNLYILFSRLSTEYADSRADQVIIFGSAAFFYLAFYAQQHAQYTWALKGFVLLLAGFAVGMAWLIRRLAPQAKLTSASYAAASAVLTVIATFISLGQHWLIPALSVEMAVLGWVGLRLDMPAVRRGAYLLGVIVLTRFADALPLHLEPFEQFVPVFNGRFLTCATAVSGCYALLRSVLGGKEKLGKQEQHIPLLLFIIAQALSLALLSAEVHDFFRFRAPSHNLSWNATHYAYQLSLSVLWALYASLLVGAGIVRRFRAGRVLGILLLAVTVLKVFLVDLSSLQTFYRIISFIVLGLLLLAVSYGYNRFRHYIFGEDQG